MRKLLPFLFAARLFAAASPAGNGYLLHNLVSDQPGVADYTDKNLVNAWGVDASATGSFWVNDGGTGLSTLYNTAGVVSATVVAVLRLPRDRRPRLPPASSSMEPADLPSSPGAYPALSSAPPMAQSRAGLPLPTLRTVC